MIETKLQASQGLPSEYFFVVSERQYSTARTDDFGKVIDI